MNTTVQKPTNTSAIISIEVDEKELGLIQEQVTNELIKKVNVPGFRAGHAPKEIAVSHINQETLHNEIIRVAIDKFYNGAIKANDLRPQFPANIDIKDYQPGQKLVLDAKIEIIHINKIHDYNKIKKSAPQSEATEQEVDDVVADVALRLAKYDHVNRPAAMGDQLSLDIIVKSEQGEPIKDLSLQRFRMILGKNQYIKGFDEQLVGVLPSSNKHINFTIPEDFPYRNLAGRSLSFEVAVKYVYQITIPAVDDELAKKAGPFQTVQELKDAITQQLVDQKNQEARYTIEDSIIDEVVKGSDIELPQRLIDEEIEALVQDLRRRAEERKISLEQYFASRSTTEQTFRNNEATAEALKRLKFAVVFNEIAKNEKIVVTPAEFDTAIKQYIASNNNNPKVAEQMNHPNVREEFLARMISDKTVRFLYENAVK